jgi:hypothetical protein
MKATRYPLTEGRAASNDTPRVDSFISSINRADLTAIRLSLIAVGIRGGLDALDAGDFASYREFQALTDKAASLGPCHG